MERWAILLLAFSVTAFAAKQNPPITATVNAPVDTVRASAVAQATSGGFMLEQEGQFQIVFTKNMTGAAGFFTNALLAPPACSSISPRWFVTVMFVPTSAGVTVQAVSQYEHAGPLCQRVRQNLDGKKPRQEIEDFLHRIKAAAEQTAQTTRLTEAEKQQTEEQKQQLISNSKAGMSSPAAAAALATVGQVRTPQELAQLIQQGQASRCAVITTPPGAEVYIDGNKGSVSPVAFVLLRHEDTPRIITIKMEGYRTVEKQYVPDGKTIPIAVTLEKEGTPDVDNTPKQY